MDRIGEEVSRRKFLKAAAAGGGASALATVVGLEKSGKIADAANSVVDWIDNKDAQQSYEMPALDYDVAEFTHEKVLIDLDFDNLNFRSAPDLSEESKIKGKFDFFDGKPVNSNYKQILVEDSVFVPGITTDPKDPSSNMWWAIPAVVEKMDTTSRKIVKVPMWVFVNRSSNTKDYYHFFNDKPKYIKGYMDNNEIVRPKVTPLLKSK